jgi:hypothetical protein
LYGIFYNLSRGIYQALFAIPFCVPPFRFGRRSILVNCAGRFPNSGYRRLSRICLTSIDFLFLRCFTGLLRLCRWTLSCVLDDFASYIFDLFLALFLGC